MRKAQYALPLTLTFHGKLPIKIYIYPYIKEKFVKFLRFIDDLCMAWTSTEEELMKFINEPNQKHKRFQVFKNKNRIFRCSSVQRHQS